MSIYRPMPIYRASLVSTYDFYGKLPEWKVQKRSLKWYLVKSTSLYLKGLYWCFKGTYQHLKCTYLYLKGTTSTFFLRRYCPSDSFCIFFSECIQLHLWSHMIDLWSNNYLFCRSAEISFALRLKNGTSHQAVVIVNKTITKIKKVN